MPNGQTIQVLQAIVIFLGRSEASTLDLIYFCEISREESKLYQINDFGKSEEQFVN